MNGTLTSLNHLLLSDWIFEIPIYQRGYAWEEENLRDLWDDLYYLGGRKHYFGTILVKKADKTTEAGLKTFDHFEVIDGQQRLTTTIILLRELISQIQDFGDEEMSDQASQLEKNYIGYGPHYKLTIGGEDNFFFHTSILAGESANAPRTRAQKRLEGAQAFFRSQFDSQREQKGNQYLEFLRGFKSQFDRLQVMLYDVPSNAEAVRMFETVNDRGRPLTNLEKTKSSLMYASYLVVDPQILDTMLSELNNHFAEIYRCFQDIEERLKLRDAGEIQRYHHIFFIGSKDSHKHTRLLKDLLMRKSREDPKDCESFIRRYASSLRQAFDTMRDIASRRRDGSALGSMIDRLFLVGRVGNLNPLLIAAWQKFGKDSERKEILRMFEAFVFRAYGVVRYRSHAGRHRFHGLAKKIHGDSFTVGDFLQRLRKLNLDYGSDHIFRRELSRTDCYWSLGTRTIKYLLAEYEYKLRTEVGEPLPVDLKKILSSEYQTEHILPQQPGECLDEEEMTAHQEIVHRLGNLTIASKEWNSSMGNRPFEEKRDGRGESGPSDNRVCYRNSSLRVQKNLAKYEQWNESSIQERGAKIIDFALEHWRIGPPASPEVQAARTPD